MPDKSITKVGSANAPTGRFGQKYLASGIRISMRLWEREQPAEAKLQTAHEYETAGFVIEGKAELHIEGQLVLLEKAILGWCRKAHSTVTKLLKPLLQLKRPARLRRCTAGMSNGSLARDSVPLEPLNRDLSTPWSPHRVQSVRRRISDPFLHAVP
jgi:hypothetical protein